MVTSRNYPSYTACQTAHTTDHYECIISSVQFHQVSCSVVVSCTTKKSLIQKEFYQQFNLSLRL